SAFGALEALRPVFARGAIRARAARAVEVGASAVRLAPAVVATAALAARAGLATRPLVGFARVFVSLAADQMLGGGGADGQVVHLDFLLFDCAAGDAGGLLHRRGGGGS